MSEAKFTKGPWKAKGMEIRYPDDDVNCSYCMPVAVVKRMNCAEADSALIAAAPEMYEMLSALLPQIAGSPAALKVNRILAKARGDQ